MQVIKQGLTIEVIDNTPPISNDVKQCIFARHEIAVIDQEVDKLLKKGVVELGIFSPVFSHGLERMAFAA